MFGVMRARKLALALALEEEEPGKRQVRRRRSVWVHETLRTRKNYGEYHRLVQELKLDGARFQAYFRMDRQQFEDLLRRISPAIQKKDTTYRECITPEERLSICLRYLSTGDSFRSIAFSYRVGYCTVARIVHCMVGEFLPLPGPEEWERIASDFQRQLNFPNCVGAIDGKHVVIQAPANSGSMFFNYKSTFSIVLLAVVDARYRFTMIDVGAYGKSSDGGTLHASAFGTALRRGTLALPEDKHLSGGEGLGPMPHVFVADEAFPLRTNMLRPYPGKHQERKKRVFNYRLSRARRMVECSFGILAAQWRLYLRVLGVSPECADSIVKATCVLHNFLRWDDASVPTSPEAMPSEPQLAMQPIPRVGSNNASKEAMAVRDKYATYFSSPEGQVPWQDTIV